VLRSGDVVVDTTQHRPFRGDRRLELTPQEFGVLELLVASSGRTVSAEELLERVWDEAADPFTNAVKITMSRLRTKLGEPPVIETVTKSGYRVSPCWAGSAAVSSRSAPAPTFPGALFDSA
jgi:DNA-binding response OmpR family regulator